MSCLHNCSFLKTDSYTHTHTHTHTRTHARAHTYTHIHTHTHRVCWIPGMKETVKIYDFIDFSHDSLCPCRVSPLIFSLLFFFFLEGGLFCFCCACPWVRVGFFLYDHNCMRVYGVCVYVIFKPAGDHKSWRNYSTAHLKVGDKQTSKRGEVAHANSHSVHPSQPGVLMSSQSLHCLVAHKHCAKCCTHSVYFFLGCLTSQQHASVS